MSKANQAREDVHLAMVAYSVTSRGAGKLSPAAAMIHQKSRALLSVTQCISAWSDENR